MDDGFSSADVAMVSRIRIEVRGGSMEAAEKTAFLVLQHAMQAAFLEGVTSGRGDYTDHFFNRPEVTRKLEDGPEAWTELGMLYAGRLAFTFYPAVQDGGIEQHGFEVTAVDDYTPHGLYGHEGSTEKPIRTDVTDKTFVLHRGNEIRRESLGIVIGPAPFAE